MAERAAGEQQAVRVIGRLDELVGLRRVDCQRLLDQQVLARIERALGDLVMGRGLGADDDRVGLFLPERLLHIGRQRHAGIPARDLVQPRRALVADPAIRASGSSLSTRT